MHDTADEARATAELLVLNEIQEGEMSEESRRTCWGKVHGHQRIDEREADAVEQEIFGMEPGDCIESRIWIATE